MRLRRWCSEAGLRVNGRQGGDFEIGICGILRSIKRCSGGGFGQRWNIWACILFREVRFIGVRTGRN